MAENASISIRGTITGGPGGAIQISPADITSAAAIGSRTKLTLTVGFTAITVPSGYTAVLIAPPIDNAVTITLKGITGDTGVALAVAKPTLICLGASAAFGLTVSGTVVLDITWI